MSEIKLKCRYPDCGLELPLECFYKKTNHNNHGRQYFCKNCSRKAALVWAKEKSQKKKEKLFNENPGKYRLCSCGDYFTLTKLAPNQTKCICCRKGFDYEEKDSLGRSVFWSKNREVKPFYKEHYSELSL